MHNYLPPCLIETSRSSYSNLKTDWIYDFLYQWLSTCGLHPLWRLDNLFFFLNLLRIFLNYISNAIPKVPHILPPLPYPPTPTSWPWRSPVLGHITFEDQWTSLSTDGQLGHLLIHMMLETRALGGYWLVHIFVPPIGLQIPLAPWVLSLAPPLGALWSIQQLTVSIHFCVC